MSIELEALKTLAESYAETTVTLSPESVAVLFYGLEAKKHASEWLTDVTGDEISTEDADQIDEIVSRAFRELMTGVDCMSEFPSQFVSFPSTWWGREGYLMAWSPAITTQAPFNVAGAAGPFEVGSGIVAEVFLDVGTYSFEVWGLVNSTCGILSWSIDGVDFITDQDWYYPDENGQISNMTGGFVVGTAGKHTISCRVTGKNDESTGYGYGLCCLSGVKQP